MRFSFINSCEYAVCFRLLLLRIRLHGFTARELPISRERDRERLTSTENSGLFEWIGVTSGLEVFAPRA